ncbi:MAG: DUF4352 domain-containing protein [Thermomicrobiales bacterium]
MFRRLFVVMTLVVIGFGSAIQATAQDAGTPPAGFAESGPILGVDGSVLGSIQVTAIEDPFLNYDPTSPPAYGMRFVAVTFDIDATGDRPWSFNPGHLVAVDNNGFLISGASPRLSADAVVALLANQDVAPAATLTGTMVFPVAKDASLDRIAYAPASDRHVVIARLGDVPPAPGEPVTVVASDGSVIAEITVSDVQNPFTAFDQSSPPQRGSNYVLVTVSVTNPGPRPMRLDPNAFLVVDVEGFVYRPVGIRREETPPADLAYTDPFAAGGSVTGGLGYQVLSGIGLETLVFVPASDRLVELATIGNGS